MTTAAIIILLLACLGGSFIQRVTGFGFGIFAMTMLPFLMPSYAEASTLSSSMAMMTSIYVMIKMWKHIQWKKLIIVLLMFLLVSFFCIRQVANIDSHHLRKVLGVILIFVSLYFIFINGKIKVKPTVPVQAGLGTLSGVMGGFFSMQGPPVVLYFLACTQTKEQYVALAQTFFALGNIVMTCFRATQGFVTGTVCKAWLIAFPMIVLGNWIGGKVFDKLSISLLSNIIYVFIGVSGVIALIF